jgi:hypothetical protein
LQKEKVELRESDEVSEPICFYAQNV